nr:alpha-galactosidase [Planctomycetales bacterium]
MMLVKMRGQLWTACVLGCLVAGLGSSAVAADWVRFAADGSKIVVETPGISSFRGISSALYDVEGKTHRVGTRGYQLLAPVRSWRGTTPFGEAVISRASFAAAGSPYQYTLTLKRLTPLRAFTLQAVFHNRSDQDVNLRQMELLDLRQGAGGSLVVGQPADWLVTPLMEATPAVSLATANKTFNEAALIYHAGGHGFLVGPVGPAEAYTQLLVRDQELSASVQMDNVLVRAGESRRGEEMIFAFEPSQVATQLWTRWVATTHGVRRHKGPIYGWCSWYDRTTKIDAAHVLDVTKTIADHPNVFGKGVIQIDDGYQKMDGDWSANDKFPQGMASVAEQIRAAGCLPGVWFAPLMIHPEHPWGRTHPDAIQT